MKSFARLLLIAFFIVQPCSLLLPAQDSSAGYIEQNEVTKGPGPEAAAEGTSGHEAETPVREEHKLDPLFFIILALIVGAATRHFLRKSPLPFTVMLLIIGLILGLVTRLGWLQVWNLGIVELDMGVFSRSISWAGHIDPQIFLFTFLPVLIFEAAFAMDVHTFNKSMVNSILLAAPGIVIALILTALVVIICKFCGLGFELWSWQTALMFGAVISATDPVAVVALLKELGASKKLNTLIEGESLMNDGTSIVLFIVFFAAITGTSSDSSPLVDFARVSFGGVFVGVITGYITLSWIRKVHNDALVEMSVIIGFAYLTFFLAEHFFHVSGVLAVMTMGLIMAGIGRTRISPEVEHFMREFWDLAGFIANSLLFLIVGVVIAERSVFSLQDFIILGILYIGIHFARFFMILILYPLLRKSGYGLPVKDAVVVWYSGLRGAIALALSLIVSAEEIIPETVRNQFLFYTAGIVTLTLFINATTIKTLIDKLGLTRLTPERQMMINASIEYLRQSTEKSLEKIRKNRHTSKANFAKVIEFLPDTREKFPHVEVGADTAIYETRRRILEKEKSSYWNLFTEGIISPASVNRLSDGINEVIDKGGTISLSERKDLEEEWKAPDLVAKVQSWPFLRRIVQHYFFERLAVSYETALGFVLAQEETLKLLESMIISAQDEEEKKMFTVIEHEINENRIHGLTYLRNIRNSYTEIYTAISTKQAIRALLNAETHTVERLQGRGRINASEAERMYHSVSERMKKLMESPPAFSMPQSFDLLKSLPWLKDIDDARFRKVSELFHNRIFSVGQDLIRPEGKEDGLFIIQRGNVKVTTAGKIMDILGAGQVVGEMAFLTSNPRTAAVTAESPVTAFWISSANLKKAVRQIPELEEKLWAFASRRIAENLLIVTVPYSTWPQDDLKEWTESGSMSSLENGSKFAAAGKIGVLLSGQVYRGESPSSQLKSPLILAEGDEVAGGAARLFSLRAR